MKETIRQAGYYYLYFNPQTKQHVLLNLETAQLEAFVANKNHASWGLKYKNTHLEFTNSINLQN